MQFMTSLNEHCQNNPQIMLFFHSKTEVHELESINEACDQSDPKRNPKPVLETSHYKLFLKGQSFLTGNTKLGAKFSAAQGI